MITERLVELATEIRKDFVELTLNKKQLKRSVDQTHDALLRIYKILKVFCSFDRNRKSEQPARDIIGKITTKYVSAIKKLAIWRKFHIESLNKVQLVVKAFVIGNMALLADGLGGLKGTMIDQLLCWLDGSVQDRVKLENTVEGCFDDVCCMTPETVLVTARPPDVLQMLLRSEDLAVLKVVENVAVPSAVKNSKKPGKVVDVVVVPKKGRVKLSIRQDKTVTDATQVSELTIQESLPTVIAVNADGIECMIKRICDTYIVSSECLVCHISKYAQRSNVINDLIMIFGSRAIEINRSELVKRLNCPVQLREGEHDDYFGVVVPLAARYKFASGVRDSVESKMMVMLAQGAARTVPNAPNAVPRIANHLYCLQPVDSAIVKEDKGVRTKAHFVMNLCGIPDNEGVINAIYRSVLSHVTKLCHNNNIASPHLLIDLTTVLYKNENINFYVLSVYLKRDEQSDNDRHKLQRLLTGSDNLDAGEIIISGWRLAVGLTEMAWKKIDISNLAQHQYICTKTTGIQNSLKLEQALSICQAGTPGLASECLDSWYHWVNSDTVELLFSALSQSITTEAGTI